MEFLAIIKIAKSAKDKAVLMLNLNRHVRKGPYPNGGSYIKYMRALRQLLKQFGSQILWQMPAFRQPVGGEKLEKTIAIWSSPHKAF